jgi:phospholipid/cholesterol/gamma-HCH transport system substrate-binding protein
MSTAKRSSFATDFSVGFVLFVATLILIAALFLVGGPTEFFGKPTQFVLTVPSASGLKVGSTVNVSGVKVGTVAAIDLVSPEDPAGGVDDAVRITLAVHHSYADRIREDSVAWIQTEGLLGDTSIHIGLGTRTTPVLVPGASIPYKSRSLLDDIAGVQITKNTADLLETLIGMLRDLNRGEGTLGQLLKNEELYRNINDFTRVLAEATKQLQGISSEIETLLVAVRTSRGTLGKLISDPRLYDEAVSVVERIDEALEESLDSRSVFARLLSDPALGERFGVTAERLEKGLSSLEKILALVEEGEGTLGMLVHDPSVAASLRDVFLGVKEHGYMLNVVRNAERAGRDAYLRGLTLSGDDELERLRVRAMAAVREAGSTGGPVPAAARESESPEGAPSVEAPEGPPAEGPPAEGPPAEGPPAEGSPGRKAADGDA